MPIRIRRGFTLIELLVVLAILGVLLALLLPAVQQARETARRSVCASKLHQLGVALHHYHDLHSRFPPGYVSDFDGTGADTGAGWGWAALTLPFLEEGTLHSTIRFEAEIAAPENATVRLRKVSSLVCPSEPRDQTWTASRRDLATGANLGAVCDVAFASYVGVFGIREPGVDGDGIFFRDSSIALRDIVDGSAKTIMVGEREHRWGDATWVGSVTGSSFFPPLGSPAPPIVGDPACMVLGHTFEGAPNAPGIEANSFSSAHDAGANFAFADGHVGFLSSAMDRLVFRWLSTRAGNETLGDGY